MDIITKGTKVYGTSDDLVEVEGDVRGEIGCFGTDEDDRKGVLVVFTDGTVLEVKYGKGGRGIWGIQCHNKGPLFDRIEPCDSEDADPYSDVAHLKPGAKFAWAATSWEAVS